jgi:hypothetical protein
VVSLFCRAYFWHLNHRIKETRVNKTILFLIATVVAVLVFAICGAGGGLMMLVTLNGFSESAATPLLILFTIMVLCISFALSTSACLVLIKMRRAETDFQFWRVAGISIGANILTILLILAVLIIFRFFAR